jgi:Do/DeqQ family serine protease
MGLRATARFVLQSVTVGLAAAIVLLFLLPRFGPRPVVELTQAPTPPATAVVGRPGPATYADAVGAARPAVVNIYSGRTVVERPNPLTDDPVFRHFFGERQGPATRRQVTSLGSGVLISPQGYLLTNHHVIAGAEEVRVMLFDGRHAPAAVVGADPETDLAVLKVALEGLPAIALGNSDGLQVGDVVLAIGNPFGVGLTVTMGIVSATGRSDLGLSTYENFIQTDAAINPGNSGGALVDAFGNLVGVNTAIFTESGGSQGIGFAIPVNLAREVVTEIIAHGRVSRGWLGVEVQDLTPEIAESLRVSDDRGVVVRGVLRQGPAQVAGIQPGDVITAVGSQRVDTQQQLLQTVARARPGTRLPVEVVREGRPVAVEVAVAERPVNAGQR